MKFMGDLPLKGQTEQDVVCSLLKVNPHPLLAWTLFMDFIYLPYLLTYLLRAQS